MYLSAMTLDVRHPSIRQALRDCDDMHRNLMGAFAAEQTEDQPRHAVGLLYRVIQKRGGIELLMVSSIPPDRDALEKRGFRPLPGSPKDVSALRDVFTAGRRFAFELLASPCKKVCGDQKNSRRAFLRLPEDRAYWLRRQGEQHGFSVLSMMEDGQVVVVSGKRRLDAIRYDAVRFTGVLEVTDTDRFWDAYQHGVGPGKAYGMGMLTVSKLADGAP